MHFNGSEEHITDQGVPESVTYSSAIGRYERLGVLLASSSWCRMNAEAAHSRRP
jgi:hypothetical protein